MSDRIDFSSLDPKRHPRRFEAMVQATLARVEARPALTPAAALSAGLAKLRWGAAVFAACAALAWVPTLLSSSPASPASASVSQGDSPAVLVLHGADAVAVLEAFDDR